MLIQLCRAKIHRARVTDANLDYEGSISISPELLAASTMKPFERVQVVNVNNGERFETYVIPGKRGSGEMVLNGPTARKGAKGDKVIVFCYEYYNQDELKSFRPKLVYVDESNRIREAKE